MTQGTWGRYTPAKKADMIGEVYVVGDSSALALAQRLHRKFGVVVSRNAIIGTYGRHPELKLKYPLTGTRSGSNQGMTDEEYKAKAEKAVQDRIAIRKAKAEKKEEMEKRKAEQAAIPKPVAPHVEARRSIIEWEKANCKSIPLLELTERTCKWPINEGGPYLFCGCDKEPQRAYCTFHARLC